MIYQKSTVMTQYQIKNIFSSPIQYPTFPSNLTPSASQTSLTKKGYQSVTHYMNTQLPQCINHRKRRANYFTDIGVEGRLNFCQRCKEMIQKQGFCCKSIEEFGGTMFLKQNISQGAQSRKKQRKNSLDNFLLDIRALYGRASRFVAVFEESIQQELSKNSKHISKLFEAFQAQIQNLRDSYFTQMERAAQQVLLSHRQLKCSVAWTQEELEHLIARITKNTDRLVLDEEYYCLNMKVLRETLVEKERKILTAEQAYNNHSQQFKQQNASLAVQIGARVERARELFELGLGISGIRSFQSSEGEEGKTCREIIGEMSTHHSLI